MLIGTLLLPYNTSMIFSAYNSCILLNLHVYPILNNKSRSKWLKMALFLSSAVIVVLQAFSQLF